MNHKFFLGLFSFVLILGYVQIAYGGGSGSEESDVLFINQNYFKVQLETSPSILEGNEEHVIFDITTINDDTGQIVLGAEYRIEIFDGQGNLIVEFNVYSPDEKIQTLIVPSQNLNFLGEPAQNGAWIASNDSPLTIEAPLFLEGGLVDVQMTLLSINNEPVSGTDTTFQILFTMGEFIPFTIDIDDTTHDLMFATYFDKIENFHYDQRDKKLTAEMPFNWDENFIESIPFVHAEYYIPKTVKIFENHEILLTVNDISYFGTIDRSGNDEIVVHFLISSKKLLKMIDENPPELNDKMIFGIQSGKLRDVQKSDASLEDGDKIIQLSSEEDWKFHLSLSPKGKINPGNDITLHIEFHDPISNVLIQQNIYDLDVFLNGKIIESKKGLEAFDGTDSVKVNFDDVGSVLVRISNVNGFDTSGEFSFKVSEPKVEMEGDYFVDIAIDSSLPGCENDDLCYIPSNLNIEPSQVVLWDNKDSFAHTVTSGSPDDGSSGSFDSGIVAAGEKFSFKFEKQGVFDYFCTLHPWMTGSITVGTPQSAVPAWIKNNAGWWAEGAINDDAFIQGIQYLVKEDILKIPPTSQGQGTGSNEIPAWIKNNAGWWAEGAINDDAFIQGIQFLIKEGILQILN
ncbi:plastocyanin/azurin family copper-binding protein [Nitrosopumilus sp. b2]|uniref:cupredoxin domain-containing protein n=1 Tax=Nitrosopumilus sp. b2 TaxID=2109908 RepID=UPI0015F6D1E6|nr:plastocyanin/azurin family copper-binding protein [Nitrosopumilus sp. b2]